MSEDLGKAETVKQALMVLLHRLELTLRYPERSLSEYLLRIAIPSVLNHPAKSTDRAGHPVLLIP